MVTCILAFNLLGEKLPPLVISRVSIDKLAKTSGVHVLATEKAWATQHAFRKWISKILPLVVRGSKRGLSIWDSANWAHILIVRLSIFLRPFEIMSRWNIRKMIFNVARQSQIGLQFCIV